MFKLFTKKELQPPKITLEIHNRLIDIRIGRQYARGDNMGGNTYECFSNTAEEVYNSCLESSNALQDVHKAYFIEGYELQTEELSRVVTMNFKNEGK